MSGILIYTDEQAKRNAFAIEKFKKNLDILLVDETYRGEADFVINRTNDYKIARFYENRGVRVFNPASLSKIANDKQACYDFMEKNGVPVMETRYHGVPAVKKPIDGHGGSGVEMIKTPEEFKDGCVYQKPCDTLGKDLRVWVIGKKITASILRVSESDFRSNFCLGGKAIPYDLSKSETALINKIISLIKSDYIGIDFLFHKNQLVFNEIEDSVGARMVYTKTDTDIIKQFCDYIKENINGSL